MADKKDRAGERCTACRAGQYEEVVWPKKLGIFEVFKLEEVRCNKCGSIRERWIG